VSAGTGQTKRDNNPITNNYVFTHEFVEFGPHYCQCRPRSHTLRFTRECSIWRRNHWIDRRQRSRDGQCWRPNRGRSRHVATNLAATAEHFRSATKHSDNDNYDGNDYNDCRRQREKAIAQSAKTFEENDRAITSFSLAQSQRIATLALVDG